VILGTLTLLPAPHRVTECPREQQAERLFVADPNETSAGSFQPWHLAFSEEYRWHTASCGF
jgi:hypothetical protein